MISVVATVGFLGLGLYLVTARNVPAKNLTDKMCMFNDSDLIAPNTTPEAEQIYQRARAHDLTIMVEMPETIPAELRGIRPDRVEARRLYSQAAEMGHVGAMNNLSVYEQNGWGHPDPDSFPRDHQAAFRWNVEMARRGDVRGYIGMGLYHHSGRAGPADPTRAQACFIEAAKRDDLRGILLLGRHDLNLLQSLIPVPANPDRIARGQALLEEVSRRGDPEGFNQLYLYYSSKDKTPLKREYYAREAAKLTNPFFGTRVMPIYKFEDEPLYDPDMVACLNALGPSEGPLIDEKCPRPDGPLTRGAAGLPPAPVQPFDLSSLTVIRGR